MIRGVDGGRSERGPSKKSTRVSCSEQSKIAARFECCAGVRWWRRGCRAGWVSFQIRRLLMKGLFGEAVRSGCILRARVLKHNRSRLKVHFYQPETAFSCSPATFCSAHRSVLSALTLDCAGAPGAGDLNFLRRTCSPSLTTRYLDSSGCLCTCRLQVPARRGVKTPCRYTCCQRFHQHGALPCAALYTYLFSSNACTLASRRAARLDRLSASALNSAICIVSMLWRAALQSKSVGRTS